MLCDSQRNQHARMIRLGGEVGEIGSPPDIRKIRARRFFLTFLTIFYIIYISKSPPLSTYKLYAYDIFDFPLSGWDTFPYILRPLVSLECYRRPWYFLHRRGSIFGSRSLVQDSINKVHDKFQGRTSTSL